MMTSVQFGRVLCMALVIALAAAASRAADNEDPAEPSAVLQKLTESVLVQPSGEVEWSADHVEIQFGPDGKTYTAVAEGNVRAADEAAELQCDLATYRQAENVVEAEGDIVLTQPEVTLEADRVTYDFGNSTGSLENARCEISLPKLKPEEPVDELLPAEKEARLFVHASKLEQTAPGQSQIEGAGVTTCDLPKPHYHVSARSAEFHYGNRIVLRHATVWLGPIPIFYFPRYTYVMDDQRPRVEFETGRITELGEYLRLGFNFSPMPDIDLTLRTDAYSRAGYGFGLDGKFKLFKPETDVEPGSAAEPARGQGEFKTYIAKDERGRAEVYYRHEFPDDWVGLVQFEHWSDRDFVKDFYFDEFEQRTEPESLVNLTKTWDDAVLSMTVREQVTAFVEDVNRVPEGRFTLLDRPLLNDTVRFSFDETIGYLNHEPHGSSTARNRAAARLALSGLSRPGFGVVPYVETVGTWYDRGPDGRDDRINGSYEVGMAGNARLHRSYGSFLKDYTELKHVVMPTATFGYRSTPTVDPDKHFWFDALDDAYRTSHGGMQLDNRLYGRKEDGTQRELARLTLYGGSDFTSQYRTTRDFEAWFDVYLTEWMTFTSSAETHRGEMDFERASASIKFEQPGDPKERMFSIGYVYGRADMMTPDDEIVTDTLNRDLKLQFATRLGEKYKFQVTTRFDFEDSKLERHEYMIERDMHCFTGAVAYRKRRTSTDVYIVISLKAFPGSPLKM